MILEKDIFWENLELLDNADCMLECLMHLGFSRSPWCTQKVSVSHWFKWFEKCWTSHTLQLFPDFLQTANLVTRRKSFNNTRQTFACFADSQIFSDPFYSLQLWQCQEVMALSWPKQWQKSTVCSPAQAVSPQICQRCSPSPCSPSDATSSKHGPPPLHLKSSSSLGRSWP